ncbi:MAG: amino acid ABC transporter substrate-binding protein [Paracoccaceae bacterium]
MSDTAAPDRRRRGSSAARRGASTPPRAGRRGASRAAAALGLLLVAAFGPAAADPALLGLEPLAAEPPGDALDRIRARGAIRLGYRLDAPPFSYEGPDGAPAGLAVRLCAAVARTVAAAAAEPSAGVPVADVPGDAGTPPTLEWVPVTATGRFEALADGVTDLHCGPATQTLARRLHTDFSIPYFVDGAGLVFRKGGPERLGDLTDEAVGVLAGTTTETVLRRLLAERAPEAEAVRYPSHVAGLAALERGEIEAYMADRSILLYQLGALRPAVQPVIAARTWSREPYALAMRRGESRLRLAVDAGLSRLYASGEIYALIRESLGRVEIGRDSEGIYEVVSIPE